MGKIFYLMGKSSSGKDTLYQRLKEETQFPSITLYTTRPIRQGEVDGREYHFVTTETLEQCRDQGTLIECRTYETIHGPWSYFTVDDGQLDLEKNNYLVIGTLESYVNMQQYFGEAAVVPLYVFVEDGERLARALERERRQETPRYAELCRRFLADAEDFSEEKLVKAGITQGFENTTVEECFRNLMLYISGKVCYNEGNSQNG